jgi:hypothetical protein
LAEDTSMTVRPGRGEGAATGSAGEAGMVTAELAVALPTVVIVLLVAVGALVAVATQLRCTDAAATAARLVARGETATVARAAAREVAGAKARVEVATSVGSVTVVVRAPAGVPVLGAFLRFPSVAASFTSPLEPGVR